VVLLLHEEGFGDILDGDTGLLDPDNRDIGLEVEIVLEFGVEPSKNVDHAALCGLVASAADSGVQVSVALVEGLDMGEDTEVVFHADEEERGGLGVVACAGVVVEKCLAGIVEQWPEEND
jgi:hypothetical protein